MSPRAFRFLARAGARRAIPALVAVVVFGRAALAAPMDPPVTHPPMDRVVALPLGPRVEVSLPDYAAEVQRFETSPPTWSQGIVNVGWGGGREAPERQKGWIRDGWILLDAMDRAGDWGEHQFLGHRGIFRDANVHNEYQETLHMREKGALALLSDHGGIGRDAAGKRVRHRSFNVSNPSWAKNRSDSVYMADQNAPRWAAIVEYDCLTSALSADGMSQDNIGGSVNPNADFGFHGSQKFYHYLEGSGDFGSLRKKYPDLRAYLNGDLGPRLAGTSRQRAQRMREDPFLARYRRFQNLSHLHTWSRLYRDLKTVSERHDRASFDVHGNQGGFVVGYSPYQVMLSEFVDTVWFESGSGQYDQFKLAAHNAWGSFRLQMGDAMARGRKPMMFMSRVPELQPDLVGNAWAEVSAGGGVLLFNQKRFAEPRWRRLMTDWLEFRDEHREIFEFRGRRRYAQVAVLYSIPTFLFEQSIPNFTSAGMNNLGGTVRALEEGHVPYDVVILDHPEFRPDRVDLETLLRYRVIALPGVSLLSRRHEELLRQYLQAGGRLVWVGALGERDENGRRRETPSSKGLAQAGRIIQLLGGEEFPSSRSRDSDETRARAKRAFERIRSEVGEPILQGPLSRLVWVKTWLHAGNDDAGLLSAHFVNYDFENGHARASRPVRLSLRLPGEGRAGAFRSVEPEAVMWLAPGESAVSIPFDKVPGGIEFVLPSLRVYGVLLVGPRGLDAVASLVRRGDQHLVRARRAVETLEAAAASDFAKRLAAAEARRPSVVANSQAQVASRFAAGAESLLRAAAKASEQHFLASLAAMAPTRGVQLALDFGARGDHGKWRAVGAGDDYRPRRGWGWLPSVDASTATPEERFYLSTTADRGNDPNAIYSSSLFGWPHETPAPMPLRRSLFGARAARFRIDVAPGRYVVDVVNSGGSWANRQYLVSGAARVGDRAVLFDTPLELGQLTHRSFAVDVKQDHLEIEFGGATGWGLAALWLRRLAPDEFVPQGDISQGGIREWRLSPRHPNPDWYPLEDLRPLANLALPPLDDWTPARASAGLAWVDLGTVADAETGDVVYAASVISRDVAGSARLHVGSTSSAAVFLNGEKVGFLPNVKGLERDEAVIPLSLRAGRNVLVLQLERFWERRWLFYAAVTDLEPPGSR